MAPIFVPDLFLQSEGYLRHLTRRRVELLENMGTGTRQNSETSKYSNYKLVNSDVYKCDLVGGGFNPLETH